MPKPILKPGKVVVLLSGRFAGHKAVIVRAFDATKKRPYGHCLLCGVARAPKRVTKAMPLWKARDRCRVKPFVKIVNNSHFMPTRYSYDIEDMAKLFAEKSDAGKKVGGIAKRKVRFLFERRYISGKNTWFFSKLRF